MPFLKRGAPALAHFFRDTVAAVNFLNVAGAQILFKVCSGNGADF